MPKGKGTYGKKKAAHLKNEKQKGQVLYLSKKKNEIMATQIETEKQ